MQADLGGLGFFQSHNKQCNLLAADMHAKRLKLAAMCSLKMCSDRYPDGPDACTHLDELLEEYRQAPEALFRPGTIFSGERSNDTDGLQ